MATSNHTIEAYRGQLSFIERGLHGVIDIVGRQPGMDILMTVQPKEKILMPTVSAQKLSCRLDG